MKETKKSVILSEPPATTLHLATCSRCGYVASARSEYVVTQTLAEHIIEAHGMSVA